MSRTYRVIRDSSSFIQNDGYCGKAKKMWVFLGNKGAKEFKRRINKRCRRHDKAVIAEAVHEMYEDRYQALIELDEIYEDLFGDSLWQDEWEDPFAEEGDDDYYHQLLEAWDEDFDIYDDHWPGYDSWRY